MTTPLPTDMTVISISHPGKPEVLVPVTKPVPRPNDDEILIKVHAAGINRPDILQRQGFYPAPKGASEIPGLEVAGEVVVLGRNVTDHKLGDKVCALLSGGGYAEYCTVHASNALPVPAGLSMQEAAGLPETFFTVWTNVFERAQLKSGEWFLVHGGSSGIGTTAIMLASALGSKVLATAGTDEKCKACEDLGALKAINYHSQDYVAEVKEFTEKHGADVILDMVGGDYIERNFKAAARDGRIVNIAFLNGSTAEVNFMPLMLKRLTLTGSTLRIRPVEDKARIAAALKKHAWPLLENGTIKPLIDSVFPLDQACKAHEAMERSDHIGKIILSV